MCRDSHYHYFKSHIYLPAVTEHYQNLCAIVFEQIMTTNFLEQLNPAQRESVESIEGPVLIVAGPGSGKTRVITNRIAHLVLDQKVSPYSIGAVTFTNKASREMKDRLVPLLGNDAKTLTVGTFHSFCSMILRRSGDYLGVSNNFVIYDDDDQISAI